jgi:transposase InsO family protein
MTSQDIADSAESHGVRLLFILLGQFNQNSPGERFNKSFRLEAVDANLFNTISRAQLTADNWLTCQGQCRPH